MPVDPTTLAGLGSIAALKAAVLPGPLAQSTDFDVQLLGIGRGVAASFNAYLNRRLARVENATLEANADVSQIVVPGYPLETVSKVEFHSWGDTVDAWTDYTVSALRAVNLEAGIVDFGYGYGTGQDRLRLTYTGGYWLDTTADLSGVCPAGATPLPADLFNAWTLQTAAEAVARNIAGVGIVRDEQKDPSPSFSRYNFIPAVVAILDNGYRRFS